MVTVLVDKNRRRRNVTPAPPAPEPQPPESIPPNADAATGDELTPGDRHRQISVFAYHKAEQRGFAPGHMWEDWLAAEREVDARSSSGSPRPGGPGRSGT